MTRNPSAAYHVDTLRIITPQFTRLTLLCAALAICVVAVGASPQQQSQPTKEPLDEAIHDLTLQQGRAEGLVLEAKQITDLSKRNKAMELYTEARAQYNSYIEDIAIKVEHGKKTGHADPFRHAQDAYTAGEAFSDYLQQNGPSTKGGMGAQLLGPVSGKLVDIANSLIFGSSGNTKDSENKDLAQEIRGYKWAAWDGDSKDSTVTK